MTIQTTLLLPVAHRFWTFSIPKRLRYYFMRNRKLLSLIVTAAANTLAKSLAEGRLRANFRPGVVALIQTHSDSLDWNCHLHLIVTDGAVDYSDVSAPVFKPCTFWDFAAMTEMFRAPNKMISVAKMRALERGKEDEQKARRRSSSYVEHFLRKPTQPQPKDRICSRKSFC